MKLHEALTTETAARMLGVPTKRERNRLGYAIIIKETIIEYDQDKALEFIKIIAKAA